VYWLYGNERMKSRELLKRIRSTVQPNPLNEVSLDGSEVSASEVLDASQSMGFGGGTRLVIVREAHALKEADVLEPLLGARAEMAEVPCVTVFLSKDLDGRKKFSKLLTKKAAVVACEEIGENEREAWIGFLSKRRDVTLPPQSIVHLRTLDPWSLDIIDQELEKTSLYLQTERAESGEDVLLGGSAQGSAQELIEALFTKNEARALAMTKDLAADLDVTLPLVGLLAWNLKHLILMSTGKPFKLNPYIEGNLRRWVHAWSTEELLKLQEDLAQFDFDLKQTGKSTQGLWSWIIQCNT